MAFTPRLTPGLAVAIAGATLGMAVHAEAPQLSPHVVAVMVGILVANIGFRQGVLAPGLGAAARTVLRWGVVLVGFRLSFADLAQLGPAILVAVSAVVALTLVAIRRAGARLGVDPELSLLIAIGFSICGASAIAAARPLTRASEEQVGYAVGLVALCGSLAIVVLPLLGAVFGMSDARFGTWVGASVHDVGQVVAAASTRGDESLALATAVKLGRVALLAPVLALVAASGARRSTGKRVSALPWFVALFLVAATVRSAGLVPLDALGPISSTETLLLAAGMVGLGAQVRVARLRTLGGRPLILGLLGWAFIATVALAAVGVAGL